MTGLVAVVVTAFGPWSDFFYPVTYLVCVVVTAFAR
jgi:phosphate starvation-inducible membrane PsiE